MTLRDDRGQSLVELAAAVPVILVLFAGLYVASRTGFIASAARSAAQAEALRAGRGLTGIEKRLSGTLLHGEESATVCSAGGRGARLLPGPFPSLAGRSRGIATVKKRWAETAGVGGFRTLELSRTAELSADCWAGSSRSGKNIRRVVRARVAIGAIR